MTDLTVRGAGIFGLSIAWEALKRGAAVTVIDPHGPGAGSSGGVVGALQPHTPDPWNDKKQFQFESLLLARNFWTEVEAASGIPSGYARVGRVQPLASEREIDLAKQRTAPARQNWQGQLRRGIGSGSRWSEDEYRPWLRGRVPKGAGPCQACPECPNGPVHRCFPGLSPPRSPRKESPKSSRSKEGSRRYGAFPSI